MFRKIKTKSKLDIIIGIALIISEFFLEVSQAGVKESEEDFKEIICDDAIAEGRLDDVCPECKSGIEKGLCSSVKEDCEINAEIYGGEK